MTRNEPRAPETLAAPEAAAPDAERQRAIEDIVGDTALPVAEKQARLRALAAEWGLRPDAAQDVDPLEAQVYEALSLLAEGGHPPSA